MANSRRGLRSVPDGGSEQASNEDLLLATAQGDQVAFAELYDRIAGLVYGIVRRVVRDPSQSDEVTQEIFVEVWRTAARFDPDRGAAQSWILTMAHRRAVDRVRSEQAGRDRTEKVGQSQALREFDEVADTVETSIEHQEVRDALGALTDLQRQAVELAYFQGYTYREVADLLQTPLGTVKTRMRDGLIRLRDAMGVTT